MVAERFFCGLLKEKTYRSEQSEKFHRKDRNMLDIVIAGAGGCGREVYEMALEIYSADGYQIKGFLSDFSDDLDKFPDIQQKAPIVGTIKNYSPRPNERVIVAIGEPKGRRKVIEILQDRGAQFISLIHPAARVSPTAVLGEGIVIYPFATVDCYAKIEDFCLLCAYAACGHDATIGMYSVLAPYAIALGFSVVGADCFLAAHSTLAPKKSIGNGTVISANSVALRNAPERSFVYGALGRIR